MLRRLLLPILLLLPAPLAAQFTPFSAPGGELFYQINYIGGRGTGILWGGTTHLYLLDDTGTPVRQFWQDNDAAHGLLGIFSPGEIFGIRISYSNLPNVDDTPVILGGSLVPNLTMEARVGPDDDHYVLTGLNVGTTPEPMSVALLATGLLGLGVVAWRKRQGTV